MKIQQLLAPWKRTGLQLSLLAGLALALALAPKPPAVAGMDECPLEGECTFKKPNFLFILDYSTAMNTELDDNLTRWEAAAGAVQELVVIDNGYLDQNGHIALMRFGHDPNPNVEGTPIPGDSSGIVDGQKLDVHWYDPNDESKAYFECNGQAVIDALDSIPAPLNGSPTGIDTWTKGALEYAHTLINQSLADHPDDVSEARFYGIFVLTHGDWTNPNGVGQDADNNPANTAADMVAGVDLPGDTNVYTYVVFYGDEGSASEASAEELAMAGGTQIFIPGTDFMQLATAVFVIVNDAKDSSIHLDCGAEQPRIMVILDASSTMLNTGGGTIPAPKGESGWDQARSALSGDLSIFDIDVDVGTENVFEDVADIGLLVFGDNSPAPGEQKILVNYGPCRKDNFRWALAPEISHPNCLAPDYTPLLGPNDYIIPDCNDPWNGPPIAWAFEAVAGGLPDPTSNPQGPGFDSDTQTHMPKCEGPGPACAGSGSYTHLGLELAASNQAAYHEDQLALGNVHVQTPYSNILITHGRYDGYSTDAQVQSALETMYQQGITTYVVGMGDGADTPEAVTNLQNMAMWGSGGNQDYIPGDNQQAIEMALTAILDESTFDPCCPFNKCSTFNEPTTGEVDIPPDACADDQDCPENYSCEILGRDMYGICVFEGCLSDDDCEPGQICAVDTGNCELYCSDDSHCEGTQVCHKQTGECHPGVCPDDFECQPGELCKGGICIQTCPDIPCGAGEFCIDSVCTPDNASTSTPGTTASGTMTTSEASAGPTSDAGTESASTTGEATEGGCSCSTDEESPRGATGTLMLLGLASVLRRRR